MKPFTLLVWCALQCSTHSTVVQDRDWPYDLDQTVFSTKREESKFENNGTLPVEHDYFLFKRQSCRAGYGRCASNDGCCPLGGICCSGGCAPSGAKCCSLTTFCYASEICCSSGICAEGGGECCYDGGSCTAGNVCVRFPNLNRAVCCTDLECTAVASGSRIVPLTTSTSRRTTATRQFTTSAPAFTTSSDRFQFYTYTYTITWTFYVYYWTYSSLITASVVRSTPTTSTTTTTFRATDSADASISLSSIRSNLPTPASATYLLPFVGSTSRATSSTRTASAASTAVTTGSIFGTLGGGMNANEGSHIIFDALLSVVALFGSLFALI